MKDFDPSQSVSPTKGRDNDWTDHKVYWQSHWHTRPYASADLGFEHYEPAYRYGYQAGRLSRGKSWENISIELRAGWDTYQDRGKTRWENMEQAVQDGWRRAAGSWNDRNGR